MDRGRGGRQRQSEKTDRVCVCVRESWINVAVHGCLGRVQRQRETERDKETKKATKRGRNKEIKKE